LEIQSLRWVLAKLSTVRECLIQGVSSGTRWGALDPTLCDALLDFIARQSLHSLRVWILKDIPRAVLLRLVISASTLSFFETYVEKTVTEPLDAALHHSACIETLMLDSQSTSVAELFSCVPLSAYTAHLRRLSVVLGDSMSMKIILATAPTLQHMRLDCIRAFPIIFSRALAQAFSRS
jgi:hypothetical protein